MRKFLLILVLLAGKFAFAQQYNNEWIDYSKTYYKFKIAQTGLYRINQNVLPTAISNIPAEQFQLWRNGKQVTLYTSVATGALGTGGYIEFWGEKNDGVADKPLYLDPAYQLSDRISLETDTAAYFLTIHTNTSANLRFIDQANPVAGNSLPAQQFFMHTARHDFKNVISRGRFQYLGVNVYSSSYDYGEWWSSGDINPATPRDISFGGLNVASSGGNATLKVSIAGTSIDGTKPVRVSVNNNIVIDTNFTADQAAIINRHGAANVNLSFLTNNTIIRISNQSTNATNRFVSGFIELTYPRTWDFNNQNNFQFSLPATSSVYIEISNFNAGSSAPVLYDLTNNKRYVADVAAGKYRFVLPADAARNFVLVSQTAGLTNVTQLQSKSFVNYAASANQGDFLIITHNTLRTSGDPVEQYRSYRSSSAGGNYNAKIYDIDELTDQFAFGISKHPLSVKNFLRFARNAYSVAPKSAFIIGRGVTYEEYSYHQGDPEAEKLNLVPTFGYPGSDILLASNNLEPVPATPIGRLAAITPQEVSLYLSKISEYESAQTSLSQTIAEKKWMKNIIHVAGANDPGLDNAITNEMTGYKAIIQDTSYGAKVYDFSKATTGPATGITDALLRNLLREGVGLVTYFGHGSSTILDYNLPDVSTWNNQDKYPLFLMLGCNVGNFFSYDEARLSVKQTLTEKYVLTSQLGGIGLVASTHFGTFGELDAYADRFYTAIGRTQYNKPIGAAIQEVSQQLLPSAINSFVMRLHLEQHLLHGDPALKPNSFPKPDFVIEEPQVIINPSFISVADTVFSVKAYFHNLGKAVGNASSKVGIEVKRRYPDGTTAVVLTQDITPAIRNIDSISFNLPIIPTRDKGENKLIVTIDYTGQYDELSESNNSTEKTFFIFEDELRPVYPYNFSIINRNNAKLVASTADPLLGVRTYMMEMDTTEFFNSPSKITRTITSAGGVIEFDPGITYQDSLVYYWRVAITPNTGMPHWNTSSFVYLNGTNLGFNQSHFYQHTKSTQSRVYIDSADRKWKFGLGSTSLTIRNRVFIPVQNMGDSEFSIVINGLTSIYSACVGNSLIFNVFDPVSMKPWYNQDVPSTVPGTITNPSQGYMGSGAVCTTGRQYNFEWSYTTIAERRKMRDFLDALPNDVVVTVRTINNTDIPAPFINEWKNDALTDGTGNTLYDRLVSAGFVDIDSFSYLRSWAFVYKKSNPTFTPKWEFTNDEFDQLQMDVLVPSIDTLGYITSPKFGPAAAWQEVKWRGSSLENQSTDVYTVGVIGVRENGQEDLLYTLNSSQQDFNISSVNATTYPYIRLMMFTEDKTNLAPYQLRWWRLYYTPVPEGALAANLKFSFKDTLEAGEPLLIEIPFKNVSDVAFANLIKVNVSVRDRNNQQTIISVPRLKAVVSGDTTMFTYQLNTSGFVGSNTLSVDVNPDNDQPEQAHFNNFFYKTFFVKGDLYKPTLDVTFDGVRILNRDIVSAKPKILVKLRDESKFLALDDTSLVTIMLKYPDNSVRRFRFGTDTLKFTPGSIGTNNEAMAEFTPSLLEDGEYELIVTGKDKSGNTAGNLEYRVLFQVYNTPMISNMFNYPNPFTTSTAFVFTLTGSVVPQNLKIQILTITGKIVREITKDELGPLNIGRNITSFKWDGTDQYGQKLGNGVYLYRVVTNLNGSKLDKFSLDGNGNKDNTDKYFNKGYGKMYLMR